MNPHFFTAPFYFAFIWFRVQGLRFRVQGSGGGFAAFFRRWYSRIVSLPLEGARKGQIGHYSSMKERREGYLKQAIYDILSTLRIDFYKGRAEVVSKSPASSHSSLLSKPRGFKGFRWQLHTFFQKMVFSYRSLPL